MPLQKLTSLGRALAGRNLFSPSVKSKVMPVRHRSKILCVPPREKVSNTELTILSLIVAVSVFFTPAWVVFHMNEYTEPIRKSAQ